MIFDLEFKFGIFISNNTNFNSETRNELILLEYRVNWNGYICLLCMIYSEIEYIEDVYHTQTSERVST